MSYADDTDDAEQCAQGEEHGRGNVQSDFERMLNHFGYSHEYYAGMSINEKGNMRWNWVHVAKRGKSP